MKDIRSSTSRSARAFNTIYCFSIQLFRERLSYKRGKAYATMSKVVMGNGGFNGCLSEPHGVSIHHGGRNKHMYSFFLVPCC